MAGWQLGIDFGTSYTVAAVLEDGQVKVVDVESNGQSRIPSVVFLNSDEDLLVGTNAQHQAVFAPERFEPSPKRCIADGEVFLGDRFVPVADLVSAVLRKVYAEACRQHGGVVPSATRVTHPAEWADSRLNVLRAAIEGASLPHPVLIPEPVAAAAWIAMATTAPGSHIAVYDFGGGTFDAAVLTRTDAGFEVAGPPSGRDPLGGEDLDRLVISHLGRLLEEEHGEQWSLLTNPPDASWRRSATQLRTEVQRAKETLSDVLVCQLWVPGIEREVQLTRAELDELIAADVHETVVSLTEAIDAAGLQVQQLSGIFLVGGSSRIPLVADLIWRELGVRPTVQDNPKSVVAMGAAAWGSPLHDAAAVVASGGAGAVPGTPAAGLSSASSTIPAFTAPASSRDSSIGTGGSSPPPGSRPFRSHLVMVKGAGAEERGTTFSSLLVLERPGGAVVRVRDEPAAGRDAAAIATDMGARREGRMPGYREVSVQPADVLGLPGGLERRFLAAAGRTDAAAAGGAGGGGGGVGPAGAIEMLERYLVAGDRAIVLAAPESERALADAIALATSAVPAGRYFESLFALDLPPGWVASERATLTQGGSGREVVADRVMRPKPADLDEWREHQVAALLRKVPEATVEWTRPARVLGRLDGVEVEIRSRQGRTRLMTRLWLAAGEGGNAYEVTVTLRDRDQALFPTLAAIAALSPAAAPRRQVGATAR